ncbi:hypothetical protein F0L68_27855 [Solihabitans fulvus]|uniref:S-adenosyl methyltransferase n=1 Tax=Solihabitans fulvus TaxID=1892852 RepID=A0A5B2WWW4_9PSEU|nr:SAM-dependent methyltransferase [Solihabitans fulvus]KAA2255995.1 hypothetical protein F0L68_27855 [Solihabitans fulvus]
MAMRNSRDPMYFQPREDVAAMVDGFDLVPPGLVNAPQWRPDPGVRNDQQGVHVAVGRKP